MPENLTRRCCRTSFPLRSKLAAERGVIFKDILMKKNLLIAAVVILLLLIGAYFYFSGKEYSVRLTELEIQTKLAEKLPITKTYFFIFQLTISNPRVRLENGSSSVNAGLDVVLNITVGENLKPLGGTVDVSGGIRYASENGEFFLTNPKIENFEIQGINPKYTNKVNASITKFLNEYYEKNAIYTLNYSDSKQTVARMILKDVIVDNKELAITLGI